MKNNNRAIYCATFVFLVYGDITNNIEAVVTQTSLLPTIWSLPVPVARDERDPLIRTQFFPSAVIPQPYVCRPGISCSVTGELHDCDIFTGHYVLHRQGNIKARNTNIQSI